MVSVFDQGYLPTINGPYSSLEQTASVIWARSLQVAAPGGMVSAELAYDMGWNLGTRGWCTYIYVNGKLIPAELYRVNDMWTGTTRPLDNTLEQAVTAGDHAVISIRFPHDRRPIPLGTPLQDALGEMDRAVYDELRIPSGQVLGFDKDMGAVVAKRGRDEVAKSLSMDAARDNFANKRPGVYVTDAGIEQSRIGKIGPDPSNGVLQMREQLIKHVEAAYGIVGLMGGQPGSTEINGFWRLAASQTYKGLARMVEEELDRKLALGIRFDPQAWIAAPYSELARMHAQRANAVKTLTEAGVDLERALTETAI